MKLRFHDRIQEGDFPGRIPKSAGTFCATTTCSVSSGWILLRPHESIFRVGDDPGVIAWWLSPRWGIPSRSLHGVTSVTAVSSQAIFDSHGIMGARLVQGRAAAGR